MIARMPTSPAPHHAKVQAKHWPVPQTPVSIDDGTEATTLPALREAAKGCRRCPLWRNATQTVFGEGPDGARVVFVGEQPGDQEDIAGKPFVGPAGKVFDQRSRRSRLDRTVTYVTNAVKHFKFEPRGKRRIHAKPNAGEISACRWWLDKELALIRPDLVVALGATAAQSLLGKPVPMTKMRGQVVEREDGSAGVSHDPPLLHFAPARAGRQGGRTGAVLGGHSQGQGADGVSTRRRAPTSLILRCPGADRLFSWHCHRSSAARRCRSANP